MRTKTELPPLNDFNGVSAMKEVPHGASPSHVIDSFSGRGTLLMEPLLTVEDVCRLLKISASALYKLTSQKRIPYIPLSRRMIRFLRSEIEAWLENKRSISPNNIGNQHQPAPKKVRRRAARAATGDVEDIIERAKREVLGDQCYN